MPITAPIERELFVAEILAAEAVGSWARDEVDDAGAVVVIGVAIAEFGDDTKEKSKPSLLTPVVATTAVPERLAPEAAVGIIVPCRR